MTHKKSVAILSNLMRPENEARPTFLLGAGASFSSGVPLATECVKRIAKQTYSDFELGGRTLPEHVKTSEWLAWLHGRPWFIHGDDRLAENFPLVVEHLLKPEAYRRRTLLDLTSIRNKIGDGYRSLAELVLRGLAGTILTTNFDMALPRALNDKHPHIRHVAEVNRAPDDFNEFSLFARAQIVWLHGKAEQYTDRNLVEETKELDPKLLSHLLPLLNATPLVVVGYRGYEPSIMESLLGPSSGLNFRQGVYWCLRAGETLHPNVEAFARRLGGNFQVLEIAGFDEIIRDVDKELTGVQRFVQASQGAEDIHFDDQAVEGATWESLDVDLALATLKQYSDKLERGEISSQQLRPFMRELGLLVGEASADTPSVACILLFGKDPSAFFPHAVVSTTFDGKRRQVFGGNLITQYKKLVEWLESDDTNPTLKVKGHRIHQSQKAYSPRALIELLVNMLVHRDYEIPRPSSIELFSNSSIKFTNPATQMQKTEAYLEFDQDGSFTPIPEFSDLRNRAICDIFFGISAMERAGTGLIDADALSRKQGGGTLFAYPPEQNSFVADVYRPESSAGANLVAKDVRPVGTYLINMLPFVSLPSALTHLKVSCSWAELEAKVDLSAAGTFVFERRTGDIWTFMSAPLASAVFASVMLEPATECAFAEVDDSFILQAKVSWLLRRHFEKHLATFDSSGIVVEKTKQGHPAKRAYFQSLNGKNRTIVYDSAFRKNIRRDVVKKRGDESSPWFECEGVGYEIVRLGSTWGVRIKPFYMFTKADGITPLPGYLRTSRATRRIRFDRNASVESDLVFWGRYLSRSEQTINIGSDDIPDLLLDGSFFTVDVLEEGLLSDGNSIKNKSFG